MYRHTPLSPERQMQSYCLNCIPHFSLICSLLPLLARPIEIGLLLHTPNIPENENRMHHISLGGDAEQGDLPSFLFLCANDIKSRIGKSVSCEITDHPGLSCVCSPSESNGECVRVLREHRRRRRWNVFGSACVPSAPIFLPLRRLLRPILTNVDCVSTS